MSAEAWIADRWPSEDGWVPEVGGAGEHAERLCVVVAAERAVLRVQSHATEALGADLRLAEASLGVGHGGTSCSRLLPARKHWQDWYEVTRIASRTR